MNWDMTFFITLTSDVAEVIMKIGQMKRQILSDWLYLFPDFWQICQRATGEKLNLIIIMHE